MRNIFILFVLLLSHVAFCQPPSNWQSKGMGGGGALFGPSFNPSNTDEFSIACDMSPLFQTSNQGNTWSTTRFENMSSNHASKMIYTSNPLIRYCISYPSVNGNDYVIPKKTIDGGSTWIQLVGNPDSTEEVYFLDADFNNPNRIIMNYFNDIYFSSNGGNTFSLIHSASNPGAGEHITDVLWDGNNIYIGMIDGVLQSTNGGLNFSLLSSTGIPSTEKVYSFASGKEGMNTRFYALTANANDVYTGIPYGSNYNGIPIAIYQMDNANGNWNLVTNINPTTFPSQYPVILSMAKNDIDTLYAGGGTTNGTGPCLFRHTSTGWTSMLQTVLNQNIITGWCGENGDLDWSWAESLFGMQVCPSNSKHILITDWGFAHLSTNGGSSWKQIYTDSSGQHPMGLNTPKNQWYKGNGLENTSCWNICWRDSMNLLSGYSDITGMVSDNKGSRWKRVPNIIENSIYNIIKASDGKIYAATSSVHDMYQSTYLQDSRIDGGNGKIYYSTDNGITFSTLSNLGANKPVMWLAIDPTNVNRMYAAVAHSTLGGIYKTENLNLGTLSTWIKVTNPPRTEGHAFNIVVLNNGDLVVSYSGRRNPSGTFTASSGVFYSNDQGLTWSDRSDAGMQYWTKDIVIDPYDASQNTWYATVFSGWGGPSANNNGGGLYKTINKGISWTKINNEYRANSFTLHPTNANEAYLTTETAGLLYTNNLSSLSPTFIQVNSFPFRQPLRVFFNPFKQSEIWVTTFGNGMYTSAINASTAIGQLDKESEFTFYPNPISNYLQIQIPQNNKNLKLEIYNALGQNLYSQYLNQISTSINLDFLPTGVYFAEISKNNKKLARHKIIKY